MEHSSVCAPVAPDGDQFDPDRLGLDHISFTATSRAQLDAVSLALDDAGIGRGDVTEFDGGAFLAFFDQDGISLELSLSPEGTPPVTATITRYQTRVEAGEQNAQLLDAVFAELAEIDADGFTLKVSASPTTTPSCTSSSPMMTSTVPPISTTFAAGTPSSPGSRTASRAASKPTTRRSSVAGVSVPGVG